MQQGEGCNKDKYGMGQHGITFSAQGTPQSFALFTLLSLIWFITRGKEERVGGHLPKIPESICHACVILLVTVTMQYACRWPSVISGFSHYDEKAKKA